MGKAGLAVMVLGSAACANGAGEGTTSTTGRLATTTSTAPPSTIAGTTSSTTTAAPPAGSSFQRVDLSFVSAYILYRAGEAALVDTGVDGSADAIEASLAEVGLGWEAIGHVILTHKHPDHVGSIDDVLERAPGATVYAGAPDIPAISSSPAPVAIGDGGTVFGLEIIGTPGHTAGHISVLDRVSGILVAGDALNGTGGGVAGPDPGFSEDMAIAIDSVSKLAGLDFEVALFGHGDPVLEDASTAVAELAAGL